MTTVDLLFDQLKHQPRVLLGPGPSNLHPRVFQAMASPILGYMDPEFLVVMDETMALLRSLFQTRNELTITLPGTGMAGMEAAIANLVESGDEVIVGIHGFFGQRMAEIVERHGGKAIRVQVDFGQTIDPGLIEEQLKLHPRAKAVGVIHGETSSGIAQPLNRSADFAVSTTRSSSSIRYALSVGPTSLWTSCSSTSATAVGKSASGALPVSHRSQSMTVPSG